MTTATLPELRHPAHVLICGRKGEGKSELARLLAMGCPLTVILIDITHDATASLAEAGVEVRALRPGRLPAPGDLEPGVVYSLRPDMAHPDAERHVDDAIGLAMAYGELGKRTGSNAGVLLWIDEFGAVCTANRTPRHLRALLHHGRHARVSVLLCCPRPMDIDRLGLAQADLVVCFALPADADRERVAKTIGVRLALLDAAIASLRSHESVMWHNGDPDKLRICPPLPLTRPRARRRSSAL